MLKGIIIFLFALAGCFGDPTTAPTTPVHCGESPNVFRCLKGLPLLAVRETSKKCSKHDSECDRLKCIFTESGWMDGDKVNKKMVSDKFDQIASDLPAWTAAVNHLKAACLGDHDLPAQGPFINCPAFDVAHCAITSFVKNASPSQWKTTPECQYPRSYAAACPYCPSSCLVPQVPYGTCNACLALPRSA